MEVSLPPETQEVLIKDNMSKVDVTLRESSASVIDEVVITGTGAQKKIKMCIRDSVLVSFGSFLFGLCRGR